MKDVVAFANQKVKFDVSKIQRCFFNHLPFPSRLTGLQKPPEPGYPNFIPKFR